MLQHSGALELTRHLGPMAGYLKAPLAPHAFHPHPPVAGLGGTFALQHHHLESGMGFPPGESCSCRSGPPASTPLRLARRRPPAPTPRPRAPSPSSAPRPHGASPLKAPTLPFRNLRSLRHLQLRENLSRPMSFVGHEKKFLNQKSTLSWSPTLVKKKMTLKNTSNKKVGGCHKHQKTSANP